MTPQEAFARILDDEIDVITFDIEQLELERDWHLRAPYDGRICNRGAWHKRLRQQNERLDELRIERLEFMRERESL